MIRAVQGVDACLRHLFSAPGDFDAEVLLDIVWLAGLDPPDLRSEAASEHLPRHLPHDTSPKVIGLSDEMTGLGQKRVNDLDNKTKGREHTLYPPTADSGWTGSGASYAGGLPATAVRIPVPPALPRALELGRQLRLLRRAVPSHHEHVLDEAATVEAIAHTGFVDVVLKPRPEKWLDLLLVVDSSTAMTLWIPMARELVYLLHRSRAFRRLRIIGLDGDDPVQARLLSRPYSHVPISDRPAPGPEGRRLTLVLTDGIGDAWYTGSAQARLAEWSRSGLVTILQALPQHMWPGTRLETTYLELSSETPATPNRRLKARHPEVADGNFTVAANPVPVLELINGSIAGWATVTATGQGGYQATTINVDSRWADRSGHVAGLEGAPPPTTRQKPEELFDLFRDTASRPAFRLACRLAMVLPLPLSLIRLFQYASGTSDSPSHLAEVFSSGLLCPAEDDLAPADQVFFHFIDSVRERFRDLLPLPDAEDAVLTGYRMIIPPGESLPDVPILLSSPNGRVRVPHAASEIASIESLMAEQLRSWYPHHDQEAGRTGSAGSPATRHPHKPDSPPPEPVVPTPPTPQECEDLRNRISAADVTEDTIGPAAAAAAWGVIIPDSVRIFGAQHRRTLYCRYRQAHCAGEAGDPALAASLFDGLIPECARALGAGDGQTLRCRLSHAYWTGQSSGPTEALRLLTGLVPDCDRFLGATDPTTLRSRHRHAYWTGEAGGPGQAAEAVELLAALIPDCVSALGADNPQTLRSRHRHAYWTGEAGDPAEAARLLAALIPDRTRALGSDDPDTLDSRHLHAYWTGMSGDPATAAALLADLIPDRAHALGPDHPQTLRSRHRHAFWTGEAGDPDRALRLLAELTPVYIRVLGPKHPDTLNCRHQHAYWTGHSGNRKTALRLFAGLVSDCSRALSPDHPQTLRSRHQYAYWTGHTGIPARAAVLLGDLIVDYVRALGASHPHTLDSRHLYAYWIGESGKPALAADLFAALVPDRVKRLGEAHPHTLRSRYRHADWVGKAGDSGRARDLMAGVTKACAKHLGPDHRHTLDGRRRTAHWAGVSGREAGAVKLYAALVPDCTRILGPDHPRTLECVRELAVWTARAKGSGK
jgi:hypothetical protein